jgi:hypothetical protein
MIAVLDACTIINLILTVNDDRYIKYTEHAFKTVAIVDKVYSEVKENRKDNGVDDDFKEEYERICFSYLNRFVHPSPNEDLINFVQKVHNYNKRNGELLSVSHALSLSRQYDKKDNFLSVYFVTDDDPATEEFRSFYELNNIGQILSSIDLLMMYALKGWITREEVFSYCRALKFLYNRPSAILAKEVKRLIEKNEIVLAKEQIVASSIVSLINELDENIGEALSRLMERDEAKKLLSRHGNLKKMIDDVIKSSLREKIPLINAKINQFKNVWLFEYA